MNRCDIYLAKNFIFPEPVFGFWLKPKRCLFEIGNKIDIRCRLTIWKFDFERKLKSGQEKYLKSLAVKNKIEDKILHFDMSKRCQKWNGTEIASIANALLITFFFFNKYVLHSPFTIHPNSFRWKTRQNKENDKCRNKKKTKKYAKNLRICRVFFSFLLSFFVFVSMKMEIQFAWSNIKIPCLSICQSGF